MLKSGALAISVASRYYKQLMQKPALGFPAAPTHLNAQAAALCAGYEGPKKSELPQADTPALHGENRWRFPATTICVSSSPEDCCVA